MTVQLFEKAREHGKKTALICERGKYSYDNLLEMSAGIARTLAEVSGRLDLDEAPIAFLTTPDIHYVTAQWGIWRAGGIAVPMCVKHPRPELEYVLEDTGARIIITDAHYVDRLQGIARDASIEILLFEEMSVSEGTESPFPLVEENRRAMILYTSGTTNRPKGVVSTHANIRYQTETLIEAWEWTAEDRILNVLPLHHAHGILNILTCALRSGAVLEMASGFDANTTWARLASGDLTLFMAVPTIYVKLIAAYEAFAPNEAERARAALREMRLMVSGSAALPVQVLEQWRDISGHVLLERYGMTELGMALSNPYRGERRPGFVGAPLPGVEIRLMNEDGALARDEEPGEIQVRGPGVFLEYHGKPDATREAFQDGWFLTGDIARREGDAYQIMGRNSVDIIKSGGYKISALEIESVLRDHPSVQECAVVGLPHPEWGELIAAAIVTRANEASEDDGELEANLRAHAAAGLASYKVPRNWLFLTELPRNIMGKVLKKETAKLFQESP